MDKVRVGIIGVGYLGTQHARILSYLEEADLKGVADIDFKKAMQIGNRHGVQYYETASAYVSKDEKTVIRKILGGRIMDQQEIVALLEGETIGPFSDFRSKKGKPFTASRALPSKTTFSPSL